MSIRWCEFPNADFQVFGLPWFEETRPQLRRLPPRLQSLLPEPYWHTTHALSGGRVRFATDSPLLGLKLCYPRRHHLYNLSVVGAMGVDVYVDGSYWGTCAPTADGLLEKVLFTEMPAQMRQICLYLPLYHPVELVAVGLAPDAVVAPAQPFSVPHPVVVYGSSITQGGCASRSGASYPAVLCRALGLDFVNLAFTGYGRGEADMARLLAEIPASAYLLDFGLNLESADKLAEAYEPFLNLLRDGRPETPIVCVSPIFSAQEWHSPEARSRLGAMRAIIAGCVERRRSLDMRLFAVDGYQLLGPADADGLTDGIHPSDRGFAWMAERLQPVLEQALAADGHHSLRPGC